MSGKFRQWRTTHPKLSAVGGIVLFLFCVYLMAQFLTSCSGGGNNATPYTGVDSYDMGASSNQSYSSYVGDTEASVDLGSTESGTSVDLSKTESKKVYSGSLTAETTKFDSAYNKVHDYVSEAGGYIETDNIQYSPRGLDDKSYRTAYVRLRVPGTEFQKFVDKLSDIKGVSVVAKNINSQDVTEVYSSLSADLESAKKKLERLNGLYEEATTTADKLSILNEITSIESNLEHIQDNIEYYDDTVTYSQLSVTIEETSALNMRTSDAGYGNKLVEALKSGWSGGIEFFGSLLLMVARVWLILVVAIVIILVGRKIHKVRKASVSANENKSKSASEMYGGYASGMNGIIHTSDTDAHRETEDK